MVGKKRVYAPKKEEKRLVVKRTKQISNQKYVGPLGNSQKVSFKYAALFTLDAGAVGTATSHVFSANGIYDPDITFVGHQPMGFDQIMALFDHYVVIGSKITVKCKPRNGETINQIVSVRVADDATHETDMQTILERPLIDYAVVGQGAGCEPVTLELTVNPNKFLGRTSPMSDPDLKGNAGANPTEQCYFHVSIGAFAALDPGVCDFVAVLEYTAVFIEPKNLSGS